ncbi:MAG: hypothetical protein EXQ47_12335 [Bryobacterales bacterium]|nr:hypothetical protein [Bryobacterales bacterium]
MEGDRKYTQHGYQESNRDSSRDRNGSHDSRGEERPRPQGPRQPIDVTGPRLPRLVQAVAATRCFSCATTLPVGSEFPAECPKCHSALHCCKQCSYFEPSTRFQCTKPVPVRIAAKDQANECTLFKPRVTVARDSAAPPPAAAPPAPRNAGDARAAFDSLFKKTD